MKLGISWALLHIKNLTLREVDNLKRQNEKFALICDISSNSTEGVDDGKDYAEEAEKACSL